MLFNVEYFWVLPRLQSARKNKNGETSDIDAYFHLYCPFLQFAAVDLTHQCSDVKSIV